MVQTISLIIGCFMGRENLRKFLEYVTPNSAGNFEAERDYSMGCEIYDRNFKSDPFHNVKAVVLDEFIAAHFFGWVCKSILLRDTLMCWILSILFEVAERMLRPWFPNFNECWWDSIILDIIICNGLGIYVGNKLVKFLSFRPWEKTKLYGECKTRKEKISRIFQQFTPCSYRILKWEPLKSPRRYFSYVFILGIILLFEINVFSLKMVLKLKTTNHFVIMYLFVHGLVGLPGVLEVYFYSTGARNSLGIFHRLLLHCL